MANAQPIFVGEVRNRSTKLLVGNSATDGSGSSLLYPPGANGSRVHAISAVYSGSTSTASVARLWIENATVYTLVAEIPIPVFTQAAGAPASTLSLLDFTYADYLDPADRFLTLGSGDALYVSLITTIESDLHVTAFGGDY